MTERIRLTALITFCMILLFTAPVLAQDDPTVTDDQVNEIASQLYCPICENVPLDVCPSQACADWRELIREYLSQGWTEDQIKAYFAEQYGWNVLSVPPRSGLNWLIYAGPPAIFVGGAAIAVFLIMKGKKEKTPAPAIAPMTAELLEIVEKDLASEDKDDTRT